MFFLWKDGEIHDHSVICVRCLIILQGFLDEIPFSAFVCDFLIIDISGGGTP